MSHLCGLGTNNITLMEIANFVNKSTGISQPPAQVGNKKVADNEIILSTSRLKLRAMRGNLGELDDPIQLEVLKLITESPRA